MTRIFSNSVIEVLSTPEINRLKENDREVVQIAPGTTPGYFIVEHVDKEELLKGETVEW